MPLPMEASSSKQWAGDPWIIATTIFSPCYIGGWSACEHWGLTEQIFREIVVFVTRNPRKWKQEFFSIPLRLKSVQPKKLFGGSTVWRGQTKIQVSDASRTLLDVFDDPGVGGGFPQCIRVLQAYWKSDLKDTKKILDYLKTFGSGALFKRFGYLATSLFPNEKEFIRECETRITKGYSKLDPTGPEAGPYIRRWNLRINRDIQK